MMLADFGAEVLWLNTTAQTGHYQVWQRGKQCLDVDLEVDNNRICELIVDSADVFLAAKPLAELKRLPGAGTAGDNTDMLLDSIGYTAEQVDALKERGVAA